MDKPEVAVGESAEVCSKRERRKAALKKAFVMLRPDIQWKNPVMFVVEVGPILTLIYVLQMALGKSDGHGADQVFHRAGCVAVSDGAVCKFRHGAWPKRGARRRRNP